MIGCEGQNCKSRETCARFVRRNDAQLVARVLCRLPEVPWRIAA